MIIAQRVFVYFLYRSRRITEHKLLKPTTGGIRDLDSVLILNNLRGLDHGEVSTAFPNQTKIKIRSQFGIVALTSCISVLFISSVFRPVGI